MIRYCGSIESIKGQFALFIPVDRRIPKIRIRTRQGENLINKRIVVSIDSWEKNSRYPSGHYIKTLGSIGDPETETEVLLIQHDIPYHPFSENVLSCLPPPTWTVETDPDSKSKYRIDLRHLCIFSIDPPGLYFYKKIKKINMF